VDDRAEAADDPLRQREARSYNRARRSIGRLSAVGSTIVLVAVSALAGRIGGWWSLGVLGPGLWVLELVPGRAGYRLSRSYGQSRQTGRGWFADRVKSGLVGGALGALVVGGLIASQRVWPHAWPLAAWGAVLVLSLVLAIAFPVLLLPIFLRSEPLAGGHLAEELWRLARESGVEVRELRLLRMGEKTSAANAMVAGLGPTLRIYVGDTLTEQQDEGPDAALARTRVVLAHELGHHAHRDVWRLLAMSGFTTALGLAGCWVSVRWLAPHGSGRLDALPAAALGFGLASTVLTPVGAWYSRRREWAADRFAVDVTGEGETYAQAFERLARQNLSELDPPRLRHLLSGSHPTPRERIEVARAAGQRSHLDET
jgi:STE24 endopeptidase